MVRLHRGRSRLQVEHTVTEEAYDVDLVAAQFASQPAPGSPISASMAYARRVELRSRRASISKPCAGDRQAIPAGGRITAFDLPSGPGVRVDTFGYSGYRTGAAFNSLIAKVIAHSAAPDFPAAAAKAARALSEFRIAGSRDQHPLPSGAARAPDFVADRIDTRFIETHLAVLLEGASKEHRRLYFEAPEAEAGDGPASSLDGPEGTIAVSAPLQGTVVSLDVADGDRVRPGQQIAVIESMKMEHLVTAPDGGIVRETRARKGDTLYKDDAIVFLEPADVDPEAAADVVAADPYAIRPDLAEMLARHGFRLRRDPARAVARRRKTNQRTARENIADSGDPGSFIEYGAFAVAAQAARRTCEDLMANTPARRGRRGLGAVNGDHFGPKRARARSLAYDYTVLAGTQGARGHKKQDRLFELAERQRLPIVLFAEGGGGRPGDTDGLGVTGLDVPTFAAIRRAERAGAARRRRLGPVLRRQCRAARLLRRRSSRPRTPTSAWAARR